MSSELKGILFVSTTALCWGVLAIILKFTSYHLDSISIVWMRFVVAFIALSLWTSFSRPQRFQIFYKIPWQAPACGLLLGLNYWGFMKGVELTTPGNTQIIIQIGPILFALIGIFYFKEQLSKKQIFGFLLASLGFSLFFKDQISQFFNLQDQYIEGNLFILFAAIAWAIYSLLHKSLSKTYAPQQINLWVYFLPILIFSPFVNYSLLLQSDFKMWCILIFLGLNTLIAYGCLAESFKYLSTSKVSMIITLNPLLTLFIMFVLERFQIQFVEYEKISTLGFVGAVLVLFGALFVILKPQRKK